MMLYMILPIPGSDEPLGVFFKGILIPNDKYNQEWVKYIQYVEGGGEVLPFDPEKEWNGTEYVISPQKKAQALAAAKTTALAAVAATVMETRYSIAGTRDNAEIAGWPDKIRRAEVIAAGGASDAIKAPFLAEMAERGLSETLEQFNPKVLRNGALFSAAAGKLDGIKKAVVGAINAATTTAAVDAAVVSLGAKLAEAFPQQEG